VGVGIILLAIVFQYNIKPYQMLVGTINGQRANAQGNLDATVQIYRDALSKNTVLDRDSRMSLIRLFLNESNLKKLKKEDPEEVLDWVIFLAEENVAYNEEDSMNQMVLSQILNVAASRNTSNPEKFEYYWQRAMEAMDKSIEASPERIPIYYQKSQLYITHGESDKALETLEYAKNLNLDYSNTFCHLSRTNFFYKDEIKGFEYLDGCIDKGGAGMLNPVGLVKSYINHYVELDDMDRLILLYEQLVRLEKEDVKHKINLAKLYAQIGEKEKAIKMAEEAIAIDPTTEKYAQEFIESLNNN
jgi:tetratricopeptide (TPR) repeat protein